MSGRTLICGRTTTNSIVPVQCNSDGTLEMTAEIDSSALAKETTLESLRTENASNLGTIAATLDDGTAVTKAMGSEDGTKTGSQKQIRVDGNGRLSVDINSGIPTKTDGTSGHSPATGVGIIGFDSGTANAVHCDSQGALKVKNIASVNVLPANNLNSGITNDPSDSVAVGLRARQTITDSSTETFLKCNASGELLTSSSGGGGSGNANTYPTLASITTATNLAGGMVQSNYVELTNAKNVVINCIHTGDATARSNFANDVSLSLEFTDDDTSTIGYSGASTPVFGTATIQADGTTTGSAVAVLSVGENNEAVGQITGKFCRVVAINSNTSLTNTAYAVDFKVVVSGI